MAWFDFIRNDCLNCGRQTKRELLCGICHREGCADAQETLELASEGMGAGSISVRLNVSRRSVLITLANSGCLRKDGTTDRETAKRALGNLKRKDRP